MANPREPLNIGTRGLATVLVFAAFAIAPCVVGLARPDLARTVLPLTFIGLAALLVVVLALWVYAVVVRRRQYRQYRQRHDAAGGATR